MRCISALRVRTPNALHGELTPPLLVARADAVADGRFSPTRAILFPRGAYTPALGAGTTAIHRKNDDFCDARTHVRPRAAGVSPPWFGETNAARRKSRTVMRPRDGRARAAGVSPRWFPNAPAVADVLLRVEHVRPTAGSRQQLFVGRAVVVAGGGSFLELRWCLHGLFTSAAAGSSCGVYKCEAFRSKQIGMYRWAGKPCGSVLASRKPEASVSFADAGFPRLPRLRWDADRAARVSTSPRFPAATTNRAPATAWLTIVDATALATVV